MIYSGFVYIWFDRYNKMFYVGSHKGKIEDGYICSSARMLRAYKKRSKDFKRRVLKYIKEEKDILQWEQYYLNMIRDSELLYKNGKYYNVKRVAAGGDTTAHLPNRKEIIKRRYGKKHSDAVKRAIKNRSKERRALQIQRQKASLQKKLLSSEYKNYQDKPFYVFVNGVFFKKYKNKEQFIRDNNCDRSNFIRNFKRGVWLIKHKRKHNFNPGDVLTFEYVQS